MDYQDYLYDKEVDEGQLSRRPSATSDVDIAINRIVASYKWLLVIREAWNGHKYSDRTIRKAEARAINRLQESLIRHAIAVREVNNAGV